MRLYRHITANHRKLEPYPFKRELVMQAYLMEHESILALSEADPYSDPTVIDEEVYVERNSSKSGGGRIDLLVKYTDTHVAVVELKKNKLETEHLYQLCDYLALDKNRENILKLIAETDKENNNTENVEKKLDNIVFTGILVGPSINSELANSITSGNVVYKNQDFAFPIAAITIERFISGGDVFVTSDVYFKQNPGKDFSKYKFGGKIYGKGKLVLAVMKEFIENRNNVTFAELERDWPWQIQGTKKIGVFANLEVAHEIYESWKYKRHYLNPEQIIELSDGIAIAVSNQWGVDNIDQFIDKARHYGFKIEVSK
jgi:hypothetical protein